MVRPFIGWTIDPPTAVSATSKATKSSRGLDLTKYDRKKGMQKGEIANGRQFPRVERIDAEVPRVRHVERSQINRLINSDYFLPSIFDTTTLNHETT